MTVLQTILGIALILMSLFLIVVVLMQSGKSKSLSGTIAGGGSADTFFSKNKGKSHDKILSTATMIVAIAFGLLVVIMYVVS